jgi:hypothetical protein
MLLLADEESRKFYAAYCQLHAELFFKIRERQVMHAARAAVRVPRTVPPAITVLSTAPYGVSGYFSDWSVAYLIATVIFGIATLIGSVIYVSHPVQVAQRSVSIPSLPSTVGQITAMVDCKWNGMAVGSRDVVIGRKYELVSGLMEITYDTGAKVLLQGPVTYEVESQNGGYLSVGKLTARVEKRAEDGGRKADVSNPQSLIPNPSPLFIVRTPTATVNDLGTEFGVEVDRHGNTASHVFRGSVEVKSAATPDATSGATRILHANESATITRVGESVTIGSVSSAKAEDFVRSIPETRATAKMFDLVDVVAGGDGFSGRRNRGIDPANGKLLDKMPATPADARTFPVSDGRYHRVDGMPFVDGVFVPNGRYRPVQIDSAGHVFTELCVGSDQTVGCVWAGGEIPVKWAGVEIPVKSLTRLSILGGIDYALQGHGLLFLHANKAVTFDLAAIRRANPNHRIQRFLGVAGITGEQADGAIADVWVLADGQARFKRREINVFTGACPIAVPIRDTDRFLTLAATDGNGNIYFDIVLFGDPRLELTPIQSGERRPTDK